MLPIRTFLIPVSVVSALAAALILSEHPWLGLVIYATSVGVLVCWNVFDHG